MIVGGGVMGAKDDKEMTKETAETLKLLFDKFQKE
jgi:hypothetical protein